MWLTTVNLINNVRMIWCAAAVVLGIVVGGCGSGTKCTFCLSLYYLNKFGINPIDFTLHGNPRMFYKSIHLVFTQITYLKQLARCCQAHSNQGSAVDVFPF